MASEDEVASGDGVAWGGDVDSRGRALDPISLSLPSCLRFHELEVSEATSRRVHLAVLDIVFRFR